MQKDVISNNPLEDVDANRDIPVTVSISFPLRNAEEETDEV